MGVPPKMQPMFVSSPKESLGYTAPMGVPPKVQPMFVSSTDFHFANYRFSFRKLQIFISQTTDSHFANYRFSFRKLQIFISQTTDFHFVSFRFVLLHFVSQTTVIPNDRDTFSALIIEKFQIVQRLFSRCILKCGMYDSQKKPLAKITFP